MKLIEVVKDVHYIVVFDSEITKVPCWNIAHRTIVTPTDVEWSKSNKDNLRVIAYSFGKVMTGVINKPLSEVEEVIYGYSVEKMAKEYGKQLSQIQTKYGMPVSGHNSVTAYKLGLKAHQELVKDKYDSVLPMLLDLRNILKQCESTSVGQTQINIKLIDLERLIQSLLPKTEWDVEFDEQGKLTLLKP